MEKIPKSQQKKIHDFTEYNLKQLIKKYYKQVLREVRKEEKEQVKEKQKKDLEKELGNTYKKFDIKDFFKNCNFYDFDDDDNEWKDEQINLLKKMGTSEELIFFEKKCKEYRDLFLKFQEDLEGFNKLKTNKKRKKIVRV